MPIRFFLKTSLFFMFILVKKSWGGSVTIYNIIITVNNVPVRIENPVYISCKIHEYLDNKSVALHSSKYLLNFAVLISSSLWSMEGAVLSEQFWPLRNK